MPCSVGMISLGCAKNQVDAEIMLAALQKAGYTIKDDAALADVAIINTCGFIEAAKKESIDEILELAKLKKEGRIKAIVVTGCLAERYKERDHAGASRGGRGSGYRSQQPDCRNCGRGFGEEETPDFPG